MIELTEEQRQELGDSETEVVDPKTKEVYILVRKIVYDRLRNFIEEDIRASAEMVDRIMAEDDTNDPYLESYQCITREERP